MYHALYSALNLVAEKKRVLVLGGALSLSLLAVQLLLQHGKEVSATAENSGQLHLLEDTKKRIGSSTQIHGASPGYGNSLQASISALETKGKLLKACPYNMYDRQWKHLECGKRPTAEHYCINRRKRDTAT